MSASAFELVKSGNVAKGNVLATAELAGTMGAKRTAELIPLCHPIPIDQVQVSATLDPELPGVQVCARVRSSGRTGVEMEALHACSMAALTIYDMCKSADRGMTIGELALWEKTGGRSGTYRRPESPDGADVL